MPTKDSAEAFRAAVSTWLDEVGRPIGLRDYGATPTGADVAAGRAWQRILADAGWACIAWPSRWGGRDATEVERAVFAEECARAGVPRQLNIVGPDLVGPVLIAHGRADQQDRWLPSIRVGEEMWCQLFSEPDAGSDLAALRTRATRASSGRWEINGRKIWSSGADSADIGLILARVGSGRLDLSMFAVSMDQPGVDVRPIRQMDGESKFNEVVFDHVEVGDDALIGSGGDGWKLAVSTLGTERLNLGAQTVALFDHLRLLGREPAATSPLARHQLADLWSRTWLLRANFDRLLSSDRPLSDPSFSILKLSATELQRDLTRLGVQLLGPSAIATVDEPTDEAARFLAQPGQTIAGGTSEIQRNILAERVLGLPR